MNSIDKIIFFGRTESKHLDFIPSIKNYEEDSNTEILMKYFVKYEIFGG